MTEPVARKKRAPVIAVDRVFKTYGMGDSEVLPATEVKPLFTTD